MSELLQRVATLLRQNRGTIEEKRETLLSLAREAGGEYSPEEAEDLAGHLGRQDWQAKRLGLVYLLKRCFPRVSEKTGQFWIKAILRPGTEEEIRKATGYLFEQQGTHARDNKVVASALAEAASKARDLVAAALEEAQELKIPEEVLAAITEPRLPGEKPSSEEGAPLVPSEPALELSALEKQELIDARARVVAAREEARKATVDHDMLVRILRAKHGVGAGGSLNPYTGEILRERKHPLPLPGKAPVKAPESEANDASTNE